jgi:purine-binding chemotaxis protein CheW
VDTRGDTDEGVQDDACWRALAFRLGEDELLVASESIAEVLDLPQPVTRIPGAPAWIAGVVAIRGVITLIVDLAGLLGIADAGAGRSRRLLLARALDSSPVGLLVTDVIGTRELAAGPQPAVPAAGPEVDGALRDCASTDGQPRRVLHIETLLRSEAFRTVRP